MARYYMGIDTGTYETKGVLLDEEGAVVAQASAPHEPETPGPNQFENDAEGVWWRDFCLVSRELLRLAQVPCQEVACLGISVMGPDVVAVDRQCRPLRKAILYGIDSRAVQEIAYLNEYYGRERAMELFGHPICSDDAAAKILWIKNNEPEVHSRAYKFLTGTSYICAKLTGRYVIDQFLAKADFRPLYNDSGRIDDEALLYCRKDQLAETAPAHAVAGFLTEEAAQATGLAAGTPVNVGTGDSAAESISCGVVQPGNMMIQLGSTMFVYYCSSRRVVNDCIHGGDFVVPGTYKLSAGTNTAGTLTRYLRDNFYPDLVAAEKGGGENAYSAMAKRAGRIPAGSEGLILLPYLAGERSPIQDPEAKGMVFGLTLAHTRDHLLRAGLEGVAFSARQIVDAIDGCQLPVHQIMVVGGGSRNPVWLQILADVLGRPVSTPKVPLGACYGDGLMAMMAAGALGDFQALGRMVAPGERFLPQPENRQLYDRYGKIYADLYRNTRDQMHLLP